MSVAVQNAECPHTCQKRPQQLPSPALTATSWHSRIQCIEDIRSNQLFPQSRKTLNPRFHPHENTNSNAGEYGIIRDMGLPGIYLINTDLITSEVHNPIRGSFGCMAQLGKISIGCSTTLVWWVRVPSSRSFIKEICSRARQTSAPPLLVHDTSHGEEPASPTGHVTSETVHRSERA